MKKPLFSTRLALVLTVLLLILPGNLASSASKLTSVPSALPDVRSYLEEDRDQITSSASAGVSYYLDSMNDPDDTNNNFIANRGVWCETSGTSSPAVCSTEHLLSSGFNETIRYGDSGYV